MKYSDVMLPKNWPKRVKSALINVISLAHTSITFSRSWCADSPLKRVQLAGQLNQARQEIALLREEKRIKDGRTARIPPHHRPFYPPTERMAILALKAARGWNIEQTARAFLVEPATISSWMKRLDENGEQALIKLPTPVNKYPDFVALIVKQLKVLCPVMGKKRIAQILARLGLHLSVSSAGRFLKQKHQHPNPVPTTGLIESAGRRIIANYPNHVWNIDLTVVPTQAGFWTAWLPFSLPQVWPFCYWIALVMDRFSRRIMGFAVFKYPPSSLQIRSFLARAFHVKHPAASRGASLRNPAKPRTPFLPVANHRVFWRRRVTGQAPKYIISDKGPQFWCQVFKDWCKRKNIKQRYGAVGKYGSIAIIERFIRSLKSECTRRIMVPLRPADFRQELAFYLTWHNELRPHQGIGGKRPNEMFTGISQKAPMLDPRKDRFDLHVSYMHNRPHLPIVTLKRAA